MKSFSLILLAIALGRATPVPCAVGNESALCFRHSTKSNLLSRQDDFGGDVDAGVDATSSTAAARSSATAGKGAASKSNPTTFKAETVAKAATLKAAASRALPRAATDAGQCAAAAPKINAATSALLKKFEGFVASPDPDPVGLPTVGFGHKCQQAGCKEVPFSFPLSQADADTLLQTDSQTFTKCVDEDVGKNVVLNDNQFGALTSFAFNLGCGALKSSTLLKRLNAGEDPNTVAAEELPQFNKGGGKVLAGLTARRAAEVDLFKTASTRPVINRLAPFDAISKS